MRKTSLKIKGIYELAKQFLESGWQPTVRTKRGRHKAYDDAFILTLMAVQNLMDFSFRETLEFCEQLFGKVPVLSTFHYRIRTMPTELIREFTAFVGTRLINRFAAMAISSQTSVTTRSSL